MSLKRTVQNMAARVYQRTYDKERSRVVSQNDRKPCVLFTSVSRAEMGSNMACVYEGMRERGLCESHNIIIDLHADISHASTLSAQKEFMRTLAQADIIFCDDYHPFLYFIDYPEDVRIVQLWHAVGAFKRVGFARKRENAEEFRRNSRAHRCYTHAIVSARCDRPFYADAFDMDVERIFATGVPRIDRFLDPDALEQARANVYERWPELNGKELVLFAPTFRGDDVRNAGYDFSQIDLAALVRACEKRDAVLMLKFHPLTKGKPAIPDELKGSVIDATDVREVNDILPAVDLLITDYSSVIYEASLLGIPMLFFAYDLDEYEAERGFFEPYRSFVPGPIVKSGDALVKALEEGAGDVHAVQAFRDKHFDHVDRNSTARVLELVFGGEE